MKRALTSLIASFGAIIASATMAATDLSLLCEVDLATGHKRCGISHAQAREVMRFVRTIPGVSHQIITIDALDLPQVVVTTGEPLQRGHTIYLRRVRGRWTLEKKVPWTKKDWIIMGRTGLTKRWSERLAALVPSSK